MSRLYARLGLFLAGVLVCAAAVAAGERWGPGAAQGVLLGAVALMAAALALIERR